MRILVASSAPPDIGGGISTYCRELSMGFNEAGHEVLFASPQPQDFTWLDKYCSSFIVTPFGREMDVITRKVLARLPALNVDAVINNDNAVIQNIASMLSIPFISVCHMSSKTIGQMLCHNLRWTDYVVAISSDMQLNLMKKLGLPPYRVPIIYNGLHKSIENTIERKNSKLKILYGGGFIKLKGGDKILDLLEMLNAKNNMQIEIFGDAPAHIEKKHNSNKAVHFYGRRPRSEFLKALASADVFLMPSRIEGCPMALLEAMSLGCVPIVSNAEGAMRWIVTNGENGYVARLDDWADSAYKSLLYLAQNRPELSRMSANALSTYKQEFNINKTVNRLLHLLHKPTVDRTKLPDKVELIHWHRWPNSSLKQKIYFRLGVIESFGGFDA